MEAVTATPEPATAERNEVEFLNRQLTYFRAKARTQAEEAHQWKLRAQKQRGKNSAHIKNLRAMQQKLAFNNETIARLEAENLTLQLLAHVTT